jgi:hypothetical protein
MWKRPSRALASLALGLAALALGACRLPPTQTQPHESLTAIWHQYQQLPTRRALALAGNPDRAWVAAMAGGATEQQDAVDVALERCRQKRHERRMQAPCLLYAVDDEIVWMR